jgi:hypothetical protein
MLAGSGINPGAHVPAEKIALVLLNGFGIVASNAFVVRLNTGIPWPAVELSLTKYARPPPTARPSMSVSVPG